MKDTLEINERDIDNCRVIAKITIEGIFYVFSFKKNGWVTTNTRFKDYIKQMSETLISQEH